MMADSLRRLTVLIVLCLTQALVLNRIHLFNCAIPLLFVYFALIFPRNYPKWAILLWCFAMGVAVDAFANTPGVGAASLTLIGALQPYFLELFKAGSVIPVALNMNFGSAEFKEKLVSGLSTMAQQEGPYLVHCTEGKDRTGFVCALLEAFAGASYDEIVKDYMQTYDNYYGITETTDAKKYQIIKEKNLDELLGVITGGKADDYAAADLASFAETYLRTAGMDDDMIVQLRYRLVREG